MPFLLDDLSPVEDHIHINDDEAWKEESSLSSPFAI